MSTSPAVFDPIPPAAQPPKTVAVVGFANCGKTTLICRLLGLARQRGWRVAAVKHSHHIITVDQPGKDTWRFREAGAQAVALAAPGLLQVTHSWPGDPPLAAVLAALPGDLDLVLVEGYKTGPLPKLAFVPPGDRQAPLPEDERLIAYISEAALATAKPVFSRDQAAEILDVILRWPAP